MDSRIQIDSRQNVNQSSELRENTTKSIDVDGHQEIDLKDIIENEILDAENQDKKKKNKKRRKRKLRRSLKKRRKRSRGGDGEARHKT